MPGFTLRAMRRGSQNPKGGGQEGRAAAPWGLFKASFGHVVPLTPFMPQMRQHNVATALIVLR